MSIDYQAELEKIGKQAKKASTTLALMSCRVKNRALEAMAAALNEKTDEIMAANDKDMANGAAAGLTESLLDRLRLTPERIEGIAKGLLGVASLKDPVGRIESTFHRPNGLVIERTRVPIGVIGIIYEARPNVTADAAGLCLKSGNVSILRGGKEAMNSNRMIADILYRTGVDSGLPEGFMQFIPWVDRAAVNVVLKLDKYIHLIIPRGGESLIEAVVRESTIPVVKNYKGVCHIYVDAAADLDMATEIIVNAKCQRPSVCNAIEAILIHKDVAAEFVPKVQQALAAANCEVRADEAYRAFAPEAKEITEADRGIEFSDLILAAMVVEGIDEAMEYISNYSSGHSESIISADKEACRRFQLTVDSAAVYSNASTRFTDGSEFGMGAEIGISTDRLHARGPMGLDELTTYKYIINGTGQVRG